MNIITTGPLNSSFPLNSHHGALPPNTATLGLVLLPRGLGLLSSAFGWLASPADLDALAKLWLSLLVPKAKLKDLRAHIGVSMNLVQYTAKAGGAAARGSRSDGFVALPQLSASDDHWGGHSYDVGHRIEAVVARAGARAAGAAAQLAVARGR